MDYEVVIIGGAMAGATLALALSSKTQGKIRIAIVEKQAPQQHQQSGFDARCIALSDGSCRRLNQIQLPDKQRLWQKIQEIATPIKQIHVSDKGHSGIVEFRAQEFGLEALGSVVELQQMGQCLLQAMRQYPHLDYLAPQQVEHIEYQPSAVEIRLKNNRTLRAKLLVGADGSLSQVASAASIEQELLRDYEQTAIITNVQVQQPHQYRAFERFTDEGPLALLPMAGNLMSLVWCVKQPQALIALDDNAFLHQLQQRFGWRLGKLQQCGKRFAYPLNLYRAAQHIHPRTALVGNAAQTLHPVAGQGFNLGIRDLMALADVVADNFSAQQDIGDYALLQRYKEIRQADQQHIIQLTDNLVSIFANNLLPLQLIRNLGLMALSQCRLAKQHFAKATLGWL
ncbi:2-octaprenyl-6-methoxyphenyl hydroxylase [Actinobacillus seminis]|uniref:2-octaprenyl-6-methoxyphenyl hydroxylase n=1 Tax=Actinobacillus seminis TaxID=722 RepID=A0A263HEX8_9PAST|nr:2-octaprenyl-6-methoxyphenyl hydroxylase [Actinobacillus seminis]OZN25106.1 2-octaprenyl-6-methoxyphenyl hydroxylase [Actinobacillus seminis]SUU33797.1 UbiH protein (2-octaprenyl-6-methoxyphenol) [Actinobacillus seminis]